MISFLVLITSYFIVDMMLDTHLCIKKSGRIKNLLEPCRSCIMDYENSFNASGVQSVTPLSSKTPNMTSVISGSAISLS